MRLTREQRAGIFSGNYPRITFPGDAPCPVEPGHVHDLSATVRITVTGRKRTKAGEWRIDYVVRDQRPRLVRRTPPIHAERSDGEPTAAEIRNAGRASSYTSSSREAIADAGEAVPEDYQRDLTKDADTRWRRYMETERPQVVAEQATKQETAGLVSALRKTAGIAMRYGVDITPHLNACLERAKEDIERNSASC